MACVAKFKRPEIPGRLPLLRTTKGEAWTANGFQSGFKRQRERIDNYHCETEKQAAMIRRCKLHGLRCNAIVTLYNKGLSDDEIAALVDHLDVQMTKQYGRSVERKIKANAAILHIGKTANESDR